LLYLMNVRGRSWPLSRMGRMVAARSAHRPDAGRARRVWRARERGRAGGDALPLCFFGGWGWRAPLNPPMSNQSCKSAEFAMTRHSADACHSAKYISSARGPDLVDAVPPWLGRSTPRPQLSRARASGWWQPPPRHAAVFLESARRSATGRRGDSQHAARGGGAGAHLTTRARGGGAFSPSRRRRCPPHPASVRSRDAGARPPFPGDRGVASRVGDATRRRLASPLDARSAAELGAPRRGSPRRPPRAHSMGNQSPHHPRGSPAHRVSFPSSAPPLPSPPLRMASRARS
jgi:hypothetical protein